MSDRIYDTIIIGGGPAGLSAALYAGRSKMSTLLIEKGREGGQIAQTSEIANYPGGIMGETGEEFVTRLSEQAYSFGAEKVTADVKEIDIDAETKIVKCNDGEYKCKSLIIASGNIPNLLGVPGEFEFAGRGVSYCATCDAPFFTGLNTYVVGGGDSAIEEAVYLAKFAKKVTIVHRRDALRAAKSLQEKAMAIENIDFMFDTVIREIKGGDLLESIIVENVRTNSVDEINADENDGTLGVFVFVGLKPFTEFAEGKVNLNEKGYILTNEDMHTNVPGVFAAGDVREKTLRQVVTATADGAIAAMEAEKYVDKISCSIGVQNEA